ncbi:MAG TPA: hypothetical protein VLA04_03605, partial [Verrucomicrobiae bacterium]|nr:hypothetical protein [Verrucomicrobiae bacterium]
HWTDGGTAGNQRCGSDPIGRIAYDLNVLQSTKVGKTVHELAAVLTKLDVLAGQRALKESGVGIPLALVPGKEGQETFVYFFGGSGLRVSREETDRDALAATSWKPKGPLHNPSIYEATFALLTPEYTLIPADRLDNPALWLEERIMHLTAGVGAT